MRTTDLNSAAFDRWAPAGESLERRASARNRFETITTALEMVADVVTVFASVVTAYATYDLLNIGRRAAYPLDTIAVLALAFASLFVFLLTREGAYARASSLLRIRETERVLRVSAMSFGLVLPATFLLGQVFSRGTILLAFVLVPLLVTVEKQLLYVLIRHLHGRGYGRQNVILYGAGATSRRICSALIRSPKLGLSPVAVVDDDQELAGKRMFAFGYHHRHSAPIISGPLTTHLLRAQEARMVIVGVPSLSQEKLQDIVAVASGAGAEVAVVPHLTDTTDVETAYADIDGLLLATFAPAGVKPGYEIAKRGFDWIAAALLLITTAPLWAVIALVIRLDSRGPIFFRHVRVGRGGKQFMMYKFRTMRPSAAPYGVHPTHGADPRITTVGRWLRRTSLDELPQLLNVLTGEMSLVGPRPEMPFIVDKYTTVHRQRLSVKPGITGLWQLSADRAYLIHENIHYDLYYIRHRNFFMDVAIVMHTVIFVMKGV